MKKAIGCCGGVFVRRFAWIVASVMAPMYVLALTDITCEDSGKDGKSPTQSGYSPLIDKTFWPGDVDPIGDEAANYNFIIRQHFRSCDSTDWSNYSYSKDGLSVTKGSYDGIFKGGALSLYAHIYIKSASEKAKLTVGNLRCCTGAGLNLMNGTFTSYLCGNLYLDGDFPASSPLPAHFNDNTIATTRTLCLQSVLHGDSTKNLIVKFWTSPAIAYMKLLLDADNSSTFTGNLIAGYNGILSVTRPEALGGTLASFTEKAVTLRDGGAFACDTAGTVLPASQNRGLYVESTGGELLSAVDWTLGFPVSGLGAVRKTGTATLTLANTFAAKSLTVTNGTLALANSFAMDEGTSLTVDPLGSIRTASDATGPVTVRNLAFNGGGMTLVQDGQPIAVADSFSIGRTVTLSLASVPTLDATQSATYPALRIPAGIGDVRAGDFNVTGGNTTERVNVTTEADGTRVVYVTLNGYIRDKSGSESYFLDEAAMWADGNNVSKDNHYLLYPSRQFRRSNTQGSSEYSFGGKSLTINYAYFLQKDRSFTASDMRWNGTGTWRFTGTGGAGTADCPSSPINTMSLKGDVWVNPDSGKAWKIAPFNGGLCRVDAALSGHGQLNFLGIADGTVTTYRLTATNTHFTGTMHASGDGCPTVINFLVGDKRELGGNPLEFAADGFSIGTNVVFKPVNDLVLDDLNRGITCCDGGMVEVVDGLSLSTRAVTTFSAGEFRKTGGGVWKLGAESARADGVAASDVRLEVMTGSVETVTARALARIPLVVRATGGLALTVPGDADDSRYAYGVVATAGVSVPDDGCSFSLGFEQVPEAKEDRLVPILTAPASDAEDFALKVRVSLNGDASEIRADTVTCSDAFDLDGVSCKKVLVRVHGKGGMTVIFR